MVLVKRYTEKKNFTPEYLLFFFFIFIDYLHPIKIFSIPLFLHLFTFFYLTRLRVPFTLTTLFLAGIFSDLLSRDPLGLHALCLFTLYKVAQVPWHFSHPKHSYRESLFSWSTSSFSFFAVYWGLKFLHKSELPNLIETLKVYTFMLCLQPILHTFVLKKMRHELS